MEEARPGIRCAEEFSPGEGTNERHIPRNRDWNGCNRGWRADGADQREDLILLDQLGGLRHRAVGIVAVVAADKLELAAVDAASGVDLRESCKDTLPHALPERG